jgi:dienelactone hydrolase
VIALALLALLQTTPQERHEAAIEGIKRRAAELSAACLTELPDAETWRRGRPDLQRRVRGMIGLDPWPARGDLKARITGRVERERYVIEKLVYQSVPGLYVTGNLYLPKGASAPAPVLLYVCGHSPHPKGAKANYQDRIHWYAERGWAVLVLDTLEFGEVPGLHHGVHDLNLFDWLSRGYTPIGVEVWNAMRGIDYLATRPEVDSSRLGMTGISGGGSATWYTAAVDDRIRAAAPVCATWTAGSQAAHWAAAGQCDCIYYVNTEGLDFPVLAALIAPRPLLILSGRRDPMFPPDGYKEVHARGRKVYELLGAAGSLREVDDDVPHADPPLFRQEARAWMSRWIRGDESPVALEPNPTEPRETPETLAVLDRLPEDAVNYRIHEGFVPPAPASAPASKEAWAARAAEIRTGLRAKVFRAFPREEIPFRTKRSRNGEGWTGRYAAYEEAVFQTEPGVWIRAQLWTPRGAEGPRPLVIHVKRPGDSIYFMDVDELLPLLGRVNVLVLNARFTEHPVSAALNAEIERSASWSGWTTASLQVWDVLRAIRWAREEGVPGAAPLLLYGREGMGLVALYAAILDGRVDEVILRDPPPSHRIGPALLGILRVTDAPEAAALLAPGRLTFLGEPPPAYDLTRTILGTAGHRERLRQAGSLPEALEAWRY